MVSIQDNQKTHFCGGVLIPKKFVLTAASCVKGKQPQDLRVVGGLTNLREKRNEIELEIDKIFSKNPTGRNEVHDNIAMLVLIQEYDASLYLNPIRIECDGNTANEEGSGYIYGWGQKNVSGLCF